MLIFSSSFAAYAQPQQPTQSKACPEGFELNKRGFCQTEPEPDTCPQSTDSSRNPIVEYEGICYIIHFDPAQRECPPDTFPSREDENTCEIREGNVADGNLIGTVPKPSEPECRGNAIEQGVDELYYDPNDENCVVIDDEVAKIPGGCPEDTREDASGNCVMRPGRK